MQLRKTDIAITGMSCVFPGAGNVATFWNNIRNGLDAVCEAPPNRIDPEYFGQDEGKADRFYCRRGGFIDNYAVFDPTRFGILPLAVEGMEPEQLLALNLAAQALEDAGAPHTGGRSDKTGIVIGKGNYTGPGATRAIEIVRSGEQLIRLLGELLPDLEKNDLARIKHEYQKRKGRFTADTAMGLIPNLTASLVANRLNLGGVAYTLDAACASSLIAVDHAVQELISGRADRMLAGGIHAGQNMPFWSIFNQLGALSRKQEIRPFDKNADGLVVGEGAGFVVLKRLDDALRHGDRIYAVIKGTGVSSDGAGTSVMSPSVQGQVRAVEQAWLQAGISKDKIGYIEAHGTGTPLGDATELESLSRVFGKETNGFRAGIGSVKSMIGHAMPAAGIAGLIRAALALYHRVLPPTLHCENPVDALADTRFEPVSEARSWDPGELPLYAGVNAFGFGGINAHVVLEAPPGLSAPVNSQAPALPEKDEVLLLARPTPEALIAALENGETHTGTGLHRIALFNPDPARRQKAVKIVQKGKPWRNKQDIWYTGTPLLSGGGRIAFLFPGLDALGSGETGTLSTFFNLPDTFPETGAETGVLGAALDLLQQSKRYDAALRRVGLAPDLTAGHSLGEWLAGHASGLVSESCVTRLLSKLDPANYEVENSRFLAVGSGYDRLAPLLEQIPDIYLSIDNCPQQVILCGTADAVEQLTEQLRRLQIYHQVLPFRSGFHSPFVKDKLDTLLAEMASMEFRIPEIPVWSATTLETYPADPELLRDLSIAHLVEPVRFRELTEKLFREENVRMFIQVGTGGLTGFIDDTLKGRDYSTVASGSPLRSGLRQLQRVLAALFVEGKETGLPFMGVREERPARHEVRLELGSPFVSGLPAVRTQPVKLPAYLDQPSPEAAANPVMALFGANMNQMAAVQQEVMALLSGHSRTSSYKLPAAGSSFSHSLDISLETHPYLIDHSLLKQKPGWHCVEDMDPVIPMTMIFELFAEAALRESKGIQVRKIANIQVFQWMQVSAPFRETITGTWQTSHTAALEIPRYAQAEVHLASPALPPGLVPADDIGPALPLQIEPDRIYAENMFHGPAYQGIRQVLKVAEKGICGLIESGAGKGSLLDNAGQLFGLWLQLTLPEDRVAFPVRIREIEFYDNLADQQGVFECTCVLTALDTQHATADIILKRSGNVWAVLRGWQNRRLEIDQKLWNMSIAPLENVLSEEVAPGIFLFRNAYQRVVSWDFILKRYFGLDERTYYKSLTPNRRKEWLISRVAAKDALRAWLLRHRAQPSFPLEFRIQSDPAGKPYPEGEITGGLFVSLTHKNLYAVAIAGDAGPVGIDIEEIKPRSQGFDALAFTASELELLHSRGEDEWRTRFWVAKEAFGKQQGTGLMGNPKNYVVEEISGDSLRIKNQWIKTLHYLNFIIGWTI